MSAQDALRSIASIPREAGEPVFAEPWEARAFALAVSLNESGLFTWPEWAERFGAALKKNTAEGGCLSYYQVWMEVLQNMLLDLDIADQGAISKRAEEWQAAAARTPHGEPIEL